MSGKEQFIKLPRVLLESPATRTLSPNAWRVVHFLMIEHLRRGGQKNGILKAPQRHLVAFGVGVHQLTAAIREAEDHGLVVSHRHGMRVATTYELTWLPLHDGSAPSDAWKGYEPRPKRSRKLPVKKQAGLPVNQQADGQNLPADQQAVVSGNLPVNQQALYRSSYHAGSNGKEGEGKGGGTEPLIANDERQRVGGKREPRTTDPTRICGWYVTGPTGFRICQQPPLVGSERCPEHTRAPKAIAVPGKPNGAMA